MSLINRKEQISKHFHGEEFMCPCCEVVSIDEHLVEILESLHDLVNAPLHILSGYRCEKHNKEIGGEENSQHCLGKAVDVKLPFGMNLRDFYKVAQELDRFGGIGIYPAGAGQVNNFLHLDVREGRARWSRLFGKYRTAQEGLLYSYHQQIGTSYVRQ